LKPMMTEQFQTEHEIVAPCASKTSDPEYPRVCNGGIASPEALTVCTGAGAAESVPELRIGGFPGPRGQTAFQLWANWVNANSATAGHTVALDFAAYNASTYEAGTTAGMANWDIVIPPYGSRQSDNVVLAVNGAKPILVWGGASEYIFEHAGAAGAKVFGTFTPASRYFDSGLQVVSDGGATTVAFVENDSSFSSAVCTAAIAKATELGMTNEGAFTYSRCADAAACTTDENAAIATTAAEVAATAADAVVNCGHEADVVQIVLALNALPTPFCPKAMLATNGLMNRAANYVGNNSGLPRGIMMPTQWSSLAANVDDPITGWSESQFITAYQALDAADASPTYHAASAVLAGLSITAAMQTLSGAAYTEATFLTAMRAVDVTTVVGRVKFSQVHRWALTL